MLVLLTIFQASATLLKQNAFEEAARINRREALAVFPKKETSFLTLLAASLIATLYSGSCLWAGRLNKSMSPTMDSRYTLKLACLHKTMATLSETIPKGLGFRPQERIRGAWSLSPEP